MNSEWQILQISPCEKLGFYKLWIYTENHQLVSVYIDIKRILYINSLEEKKNFQSGKIVKKKLPREKNPYYLYEVVLTEEEYHNTYNDFDYYLSNPSIEGIYEYKIPLIHKFITNIGNRCKINKQALLQFKQQGQ